MLVFITVAILSFLHYGHCLSGFINKPKPVANLDYLCRNARGLAVCHPISEKMFVHCAAKGPPLEFSCRAGLKFSSMRQECTFAQYGDCLPDLSPEKAKMVRCPKLRAVDNGKFHCSAGNRYESLCLLACRPGFKRRGILALKCILDEMNGRWSGKPGRCVRGQAKGCPLKVGLE